MTPRPGARHLPLRRISFRTYRWRIPSLPLLYPTSSRSVFQWNETGRPLELRHANKDLVAEFRRQLGESAVVFTSEAPVESRFTEDRNLRRETLLEWLSTRFPQYSVASKIGRA